MPRQALRNLTGRERTPRANRQLGLLLAFVAGAINAGGFLAIQRYTSHMTGIVSGVADDLALGHLGLALAGVGLVGTFLAGAVTTTLLVNWARQRHMHSEYALSLLLEAALLLVFGVLGASLSVHTTLLVPATVTLLCFIMGLQNALVTKISNAVVRTTHMTGVITDLGIELGRLLYWNRRADPQADDFVQADRSRLKLHAALLGCFAGGGLVGALSFQWLSYAATLPIALLLAVLASVPIADDLQHAA
jgi:uncharacterized membrane protein YoaK (UPF0700 family)